MQLKLHTHVILLNKMYSVFVFNFLTFWFYFLKILVIVMHIRTCQASQRTVLRYDDKTFRSNCPQHPRGFPDRAQPELVLQDTSEDARVIEFWSTRSQYVHDLCAEQWIGVCCHRVSAG